MIKTAGQPIAGRPDGREWLLDTLFHLRSIPLWQILEHLEDKFAFRKDNDPCREEDKHKVGPDKAHHRASPLGCPAQCIHGLYPPDSGRD